ncbi:hypothetical protein B0H13DRAFT_1909138 [Mycena leptocephala]|nr:hypothetical protein B0H13DRAFT_1909138 [Mycena leptocephala]
MSRSGWLGCAEVDMKQDESDGCQATDERQRKRGRSSFIYIASLFLHSLTPPRYFTGATQHHEKWESKKDRLLPFEFWFAKNGGVVGFPGLGHGKTRLPVLPELEQGGRKKARNSAMIQTVHVRSAFYIVIISEAMRRGHCPVLMVTKRKAKKRRRTHPRPQFAGGDPMAIASKGELDSGRRKSARKREASER